MDSSVLCFDLDSMLLDREGKIHPADIVILASRPRSWFVPTTGRALDSVKRMFHRNGLFLDQPIPFPMVLLNGAAIYLPGEELYSYSPFSQLVQRTLIGLVEDFPEPSYLFMDEKEIYLRSSSGSFHPMLDRFDIKASDFGDGIRHESFGKVMVISENPDQLLSIADFLETRHLERVYTLKNVLELSPPGVTKTAGIKSLVQLLGWKMGQIITASAGEDDSAMLELAGVSFTAASSPAKILKLVKHVIDVQKEGLLGPMQRAGSA